MPLQIPDIYSMGYGGTPKGNPQNIQRGGGTPTVAAKTPTTTTPLSSAALQTQPTVMPQYTSGAWANLPTGILGSLPATTSAPTPSAPIPAPATGGQSSGLLGGLLGNILGGGNRQISKFSPQNQALMTERWGTIGNGQPMPTRFGDYMDAKNAWTAAHPGQQLPGNSPLDGIMGRGLSALFGLGR